MSGAWPSGLLACGLLVAGSAHAVEVGDNDTLHDLAGVWSFHPGDNLAFAKLQLDDRQWEQRVLPTGHSSWADRWNGRGWYRLHIEVKQGALGSPLALSVGPAREVVEVYFNGSLTARRGEFGSRPHGGSRVIHLSGLVQPETLRLGDNVIALRVLDPTWEGGVPFGPLLLGPPEAIRAATETPSQVALGVRISLGLLALCLGLAQVLTVFGRRASRENGWLVGAGIGASVLLLGGTGVLEGLLPNLSLATRAPIIGGSIAIVCMASFFASRFDDWGARHVTIGRTVLLCMTAALILAPEIVIFFAGEALLMLCALVTTLYAANQLSKAARRQEQGAVPVFCGLIVLVPLLVYDGIMATPASVWPPLSSMGFVGVLLITGVVGARTTMQEHERVLAEMLRLRKQGEGHLWMGILDATAMSITQPKHFLDAVVHEAARELEVRRCSLVLEDAVGVLRVAMGVGLPTSANAQIVDRVGSIAGWVFDNGETVTSTSLPDGLADKRRGRGYQSPSFISHPVKHGARVLGVLNVSDRNDGDEFSTSEEIATGEVADKLALVLTRLGRGTWSQNPSDDRPTASDDLGPTFEEALAAAGEAVVRATGKQEVLAQPNDWSDEDLEQFGDEALEDTTDPTSADDPET